MAPVRSRNTLGDGLLTLNVMMRPPRSTTNQRLLSPGAWTAATGFEKPRLNAVVMLIVAELTVRAGATQVVLLGLVSRPDASAAGVVTLLAELRADSLSALSRAATWYEYAVPAATVVSVW